MKTPSRDRIFRGFGGFWRIRCKKSLPCGIALRQVLPTSSLSTIYLTLIQPVLGACAHKYIKQLRRLQNRAARAVTGIFDYHASVSTMIHTLKLMTVENRYKYFFAILVYKCYHREAPIILTNRFTRLDGNLNYHTRAVTNGDLKVPHPNLSLYKTSLSYSSCTLWNSIPLIIRGLIVYIVSNNYIKIIS